MTVTTLEKDVERLTLTLTAEFDAAAERVWEVWADPRKLERWWGPPTYPATFVEHDLSVDGRMAYFMTSPEGERYHGWWRVTAVDPPRSLSFEDGFADAEGRPNDDLPRSSATVSVTDLGDGRSRMTIASQWHSAEAMEQVLAMGMEEGLRAAVGQIDGVLGT